MATTIEREGGRLVPVETERGPKGEARDVAPFDMLVVRLFLAALAALLVGYMFMGRGFAHLGVPPIYVGEFVLVVGLFATAAAAIRKRLIVVPSAPALLLVGFMALGAVHTLPYLPTYGINALRDATLWGYGVFALMVYALFDRLRLLQSARLYGWIVPVFALWLPISLAIFAATPIDLDRQGSDIPLIFYKAPDMVVHAVGAIAFLVLCMGLLTRLRSFAWRAIVAYPLVSTLFVGATISRGALLAMTAAIGLIAVFARKSRNWLPVAAAAVVFMVVLFEPAIAQYTRLGVPVSPPASVAPGASSPPATPQPTGRATTVDQLVDNIGSLFGGSNDTGLTATASFRLRWWGKIVDYTVNGPYFWMGKGFGVNLADDDGFQVTADGSLRAPHNSHITVLARMGVPGFVLWIALQAAFAFGLLRAILRHRGVGDNTVAGIGAWVLVYWLAMMVNTSFDPYLEGPQGGIWFWTLFGLGMIVMRLNPQDRKRELDTPD